MKITTNVGKRWSKTLTFFKRFAMNRAVRIQFVRKFQFVLHKFSVRAIFFSERVTTCCNSLPDTVDFSSFTSFKRTAKQVNLTQFLRIRPSLFLHVILLFHFTVLYSGQLWEHVMCLVVLFICLFDCEILLGFERNKWRYGDGDSQTINTREKAYI